MGKVEILDRAPVRHEQHVVLVNRNRRAFERFSVSQRNTRQLSPAVRVDHQQAIGVLDLDDATLRSDPELRIDGSVFRGERPVDGPILGVNGNQFLVTAQTEEPSADQAEIVESRFGSLCSVRGRIIPGEGVGKASCAGGHASGEPPLFRAGARVEADDSLRGCRHHFIGEITDPGGGRAQVDTPTWLSGQGIERAQDRALDREGPARLERGRRPDGSQCPCISPRLRLQVPAAGQRQRHRRAGTVQGDLCQRPTGELRRYPFAQRDVVFELLKLDPRVARLNLEVGVSCRDKIVLSFVKMGESPEGPGSHSSGTAANVSNRL